MIIPNIWKHNSNVPNHQPGISVYPYKIDLENKLGEDDDYFWDLNKQVG